jgi:2-keto-4-pentenoate hydratase/2-oxohepta-3-ene-1,7-dioic acid hydratase in catechol pathway
MRLAMFADDGAARAGIVVGDNLHPLPVGVTVLDLIQQDALPDAGKMAEWNVVVPLDSVRLLPPLTPPAIRDFVTFEEHVEGVARRFGDTIVPEWYEAPTFYFTSPHALIGAHDDVPVPPGCHAFDFELEVAAVVGRPGRDLTPEQARNHIVGYTILNDWSARDLQAREMRVKLGPAKGKDSASTLGPWLVTSDEIQDRRDADGFLDLTMTVTRNGEQIGGDTLTNMAWTFEEMLAYASRGTWVRPGDVLGSGTCGSGCLAELWGRHGSLNPRPLAPGDVVTMTVERLGTISNTVVPGTTAVPLTQARKKPGTGRW